MERQIPEWFDDFYHRVAQFATQQDFVNDVSTGTPYSNENVDSAEGENLSNQMSDDKGGKYEVVLQKEKGKKDEKKDKNKQKSLQVQFTSLSDNGITVNSYIEDFCGGRYAAIRGESLERIANTMSKDLEYIVDYTNVSMAKHASTISLNEAKELTRAASRNGVILTKDYRKISSKLNEEDKYNYESVHVPASYTIRERIASEEDVNYYLDFVRGFKEYNLVSAGVEEEKNLKVLKERFASMESSLDDFVAERLVERFEDDDVLKRI